MIGAKQKSFSILAIFPKGTGCFTSCGVASGELRVGVTNCSCELNVSSCELPGWDLELGGGGGVELRDKLVSFQAAMLLPSSEFLREKEKTHLTMKRA